MRYPRPGKSKVWKPIRAATKLLVWSWYPVGRIEVDSEEQAKERTDGPSITPFAQYYTWCEIIISRIVLVWFWDTHHTYQWGSDTCGSCCLTHRGSSPPIGDDQCHSCWPPVMSLFLSNVNLQLCLTSDPLVDSHNNGNSAFSMGTSTISMAMFNSKLFVFTRRSSRNIVAGEEAGLWKPFGSSLEGRFWRSQGWDGGELWDDSGKIVGK